MTSRRNENIITTVDPGSPADLAGIKPGDTLLAVAGRTGSFDDICDVFDYRMKTAGTRIRLKLRSASNGAEYTAALKKDEYQDAGLEFERPLMDEVRTCRNKCVFCFIDQLPPDMRGTLYFKDDDYRLSFLEGNYITLTNMTREDVKRILEFRLSPVNISLHTTDPEMRRRMMGNRHAAEGLEYLKMFTGNRISINIQIVLCRGWNDGGELDRTLNDLDGLGEAVNSVSVVPVGLTDHRGGLIELLPFDSAESARVITRIEAVQKKMKAERGVNWVYAADEFYIMAGRQMPAYKEYADFPQLENGVGMVTLFERQFKHEMKKLGAHPEKPPQNISIATGMLARGFIAGLAGQVGVTGVYGIENRYFGEKITVSGLVTGRDIIDQLKGKPLGDALLLPRNMTRAGENTLLDNITTDDISRELGCRVTTIPLDGAAFARALAGRRI